ncbi:MAG: phosphate signaling complex protein PhoU [Epulopiscium sp.]|nr:phosphate signaling complex protein PhoU [Candidatus Epulonipiscium sp.]
MTRSRFDEQLSLLHTELIAMGSMCETAIEQTAQALLQGDIGLAEKTAAMDDMVDEKEKEIESLCLKLLLQQQPVARDLRQISTALKMVTDMERIGDQAQDICEIISLAKFSNITQSILHIGDMAKATIKMVTQSIEAFVKKDEALAQAVIDYDDVVDDLFHQVKKEIIEMIQKDSTCGESALDILMIAKYFERIGDHAENIAEWVMFSMTGEHPKKIG